ncbi:2-amino-4-hydroxy-6-hydroxymethyldihydropteridine diphosphokinase [Aureibacillus halotolerans]|uniref:2-amino-4-hydroxy-6-hydroxymethyldihydropteridine diphosphokinase n=1 Tax=Aureibacillus halotolerans TaxID=1508390 RepID=A0A4R6TQM3_9BACI|nr:2-amino-4-hydroxy-6-hydroxymethyldihydropteridine diphosphokinase [Aureibacillus halotolerans]TDQ34202.1 2-amino-4-hydroxy-6-hydroxymethyldihydropteridine diphosphokinase [Aureibacillus halotolerans]
MNSYFIALGSNIGDRENYLKLAVYDLQALPSIEVVKLSSIYETDPVGFEEQSQFLNMVVELRSPLSPDELFQYTSSVEKKHHRTRDVYWGPRTLDIDILLYNMENVKTDDLDIPHPRMAQRLFVLRPLSDVLSGTFVIPGEAQSLSELIDHLPDKKGVYVWKQTSGDDVFALFES